MTLRREMAGDSFFFIIQNPPHLEKLKIYVGGRFWGFWKVYMNYSNLIYVIIILLVIKISIL
jgi:hypothetical protein